MTRVLSRHAESYGDERLSSHVAEVSNDDAVYAGQVLDGAKMIAQYLVHLGFTDMTEKKVFHWAANGRLPVKKIGNRLVANKRTLLRHFGLS
jgi:hypothetical protein